MKTKDLANTSEQMNDLYNFLISGEGLDQLEIKKEEISSQLSALLSFSGLSRSEVSRYLNWKRSRVSKVLSGEENLTIKTIFQFCGAIGYNFSVIFTKPEEKIPLQPWEKMSITDSFIDIKNTTLENYVIDDRKISETQNDRIPLLNVTLNIDNNNPTLEKFQFLEELKKSIKEGEENTQYQSYTYTH